jgi:hypothetical protein
MMLALTGLVGEWHNPDVRSFAGAEMWPGKDAPAGDGA